MPNRRRPRGAAPRPPDSGTRGAVPCRRGRDSRGRLLDLAEEPTKPTYYRQRACLWTGARHCQRGRGPVAGAQAQNGRQYGRCRRSRFESRPRIRSASTEHVHRRDRHSLAERIAQAEVNKRKSSESVSATGSGGERGRRARLPSRKEAQLRCQTCADKTGRRLSVEQDCDASGPCRVGRRPDKRGLQSGLGPCHGRNSGATRRRGKLRPHGRCEVRRGGADPVCSKCDGSVIERRAMTRTRSLVHLVGRAAGGVRVPVSDGPTLPKCGSRPARATAAGLWWQLLRSRRNRAGWLGPVPSPAGPVPAKQRRLVPRRTPSPQEASQGTAGMRAYLLPSGAASLPPLLGLGREVQVAGPSKAAPAGRPAGPFHGEGWVPGLEGGLQGRRRLGTGRPSADWKAFSDTRRY